MIGIDASRSGDDLSAKTGLGIPGRAGSHRHPPAAAEAATANATLKALLVDSWYDVYLGVVVLVRVVDGVLKKGQQRAQFMGTAAPLTT